MRFFTAAALLASASFVAAQTTSASAPSATGACAAQNIVDACKKTIQGQIDDCGANDWVCLCDQYTNLLTCYNNCPGSPDRSPVQNQVTSFCNAAAPIKSASSASAASAAPTKSAKESSSPDATATSADTSATASGTGAGASSSPTGAASANLAPVGGALALVFGIAGLL